jgi:NitT/TauT family transport system permease protein
MRLMNSKPNRAMRLTLNLLPFIILLIIYTLASDARLLENPSDKLLPAWSSFADAVQRMAFEPSKRTGEYLLWVDSAASLQRLLLGVGISALIGLVVGIVNGILPIMRVTFSPLVTTISLIPPMAILPILFIIFGLGELSKVMLIIIGVCPILIRDLQQRTQSLPVEQLLKAQTLGANSWQIMIRVVLPQILPPLISAVRLTLGSAWLFLIAGEAIAATEGLGYRIFLLRRYLAMDVILPYVFWIAILAFLMDLLLRLLSVRAFPWYHVKKGEES